ncbi:MAG: serine/threonine protein kinase [Planctomycetota bacterium]|nr:MAG: serine/threonine protein kinase [Planctomycetota bacterium]
MVDPADETIDVPPPRRDRTQGYAARAGAPPPARLAGYEVLEELGRGGMATVYRARAPGGGQEVALKILHSEGPLSVEDRLRFLREAHAASRLESPNIVRVLDWGYADGRAYLVMDLVRGRALKERLAEGPLPVRDAVAAAESLARTLAYAHRRGIVHRDVKPGNILLSAEGRPLLSDFGLAKPSDSFSTDLTSTGQVLGTPAYMAPEQARAEHGRVGPSADLYALGASFFEMLTGRPPFVGSSPLEVLKSVIEDMPPLPSALRAGLPDSLDAVLLTCLAKDPEDRYPSCEALAADLRRFSSGRPVVACLPRPEEVVARSIVSEEGLVVRSPETFLGGFDPDYADHAERLLERFSRLLREISVSIVNDGHIDAGETRAIRAEWERLKAYAEAFVGACEEGVFAQPRPDGSSPNAPNES